ncbi:alpha-amylase family protein [Nakamurella leprariae]|uniref:Alpha-amylase family protein n=1 Tax=Nakamurella leprariae TaxID=2803911 RepID=A0A938YBH1_9ACTN|nr:alpha-amylase family protein [Nakamurella leprariae]MBM9469425.1 alpha-amylase family protein [Nakamurella leprariae]
MRATLTGDVWWKNAVVYCLDVETFFDSDADGIGDLAGLSERLDHLVDLGVDVVWLMPFYPTANVDDGYDITDYYSVDPRLGTLGDFAEFLRTAHEKGLRVIADLVVNHTSSEHPWFREARSSRDSPRRDWYVWRDEPGPEQPGDVVFPDRENSIWTLDKKSGQYYQHRFYRSQPDLNVANPRVRDEIARIMGFWMALGLSGFRVDAVPFLIETQSADGSPGTSEALPDPHDYLRDLRAFLNRRHGGAVLLGEVNLSHQDARAFFGDEDGDEITMLFDFPTMQAMYLALARSDAGPLRTALSGRPPTPDDSQWAVFARNHDELTLDKLSLAERQQVFDAFGPDESMQLYGRGLRRRLPSMLEGDQDRIRLTYSLTLSLPGTPTLFYGEEIGMAEQLSLDGRMAVRTPMQWAPGELGGFSAVDDPDRLCRPFPDPPFAPDQVNVMAQRHDPESLLSWMRRRIRTYRECPELGWGTATVLDHPLATVFAHRCDWEGGTVLLVHNLAEEPVTVALTLPDRVGSELVDLFDPQRREPVGEDGSVGIDLGRYGGRWFRLIRPGALRLV